MSSLCRTMRTGAVLAALLLAGGAQAQHHDAHHDRHHDDHHHDRGHVQEHGQYLRCESTSHHEHRCTVRVRHEVHLVRQLSRAACIEGHSWGWDHRGVWVREGCRAEFLVN